MVPLEHPEEPETSHENIEAMAVTGACSSDSTELVARLEGLQAVGAQQSPGNN